MQVLHTKRLSCEKRLSYFGYEIHSLNFGTVTGRRTKQTYRFGEVGIALDVPTVWHNSGRLMRRCGADFPACPRLVRVWVVVPVLQCKGTQPTLDRMIGK